MFARVVRDAGEAVVHVSGVSDSPILPETILSLSDLRDGPKALRFLECAYSISAGCTVLLWWKDLPGDTLILPLEGRGRLDLSAFGGIHNPRNEGWTGEVQLSTNHTSPGQKAFTLLLEFSKQKD